VTSRLFQGGPLTRYERALSRSCARHNKPPGSACFPDLGMVCAARLGPKEEQ
jgi:hypothetical protein